MPQLERPIRIQATRPLPVREGQTAGVRHRPQDRGRRGRSRPIDTGPVSVGDRAFIKFQGGFYEEPAARSRRPTRPSQGGRERREKVRGPGVEPARLDRDAKDEGEEDVAGVETEHISGQLDVKEMVADLNRFVSRAGKSLRRRRPAVPKPLPVRGGQDRARWCADPTFDVYVGAEDDCIRRLSTNVQVTVPEADRQMVRGVEGGTLELTIEFRDVKATRRSSRRRSRARCRT